MKTISVVLTTALAATAVHAFNIVDFERKLDELVRAEHTHAYYFELQGFEGSWIPTALIFGYPNNASACDSILRPAAIENPQLSFRCRSAN